AETMQSHRGRAWRPLIDTAVAVPAMGPFAALTWPSSQRGVDYYDEGVLIWLEVDTRIRELTHGQRSLDDFCRSFFAGESGMPAVKPYSFNDLVASLNAVARYDWETLLNRRLHETNPDAPLSGIEASGWRLAFGSRPSGLLKESQGLS